MKRQRARSARRIAEVNRKSAERKARLKRESAQRQIELAAREPDRTNRFIDARDVQITFAGITLSGIADGTFVTSEVEPEPPPLTEVRSVGGGRIEWSTPPEVARMVGELQSFPTGPANDRVDVAVQPGVITMPTSGYDAQQRPLRTAYANLNRDGSVSLVSPELPRPVGPIGTVVRDNGDGTVMIQIDPTAIDPSSLAALASGQRVGMSVGRSVEPGDPSVVYEAPLTWPTSDAFMSRYALIAPELTRLWMERTAEARGARCGDPKKVPYRKLGESDDELRRRILYGVRANRHHIKHHHRHVATVGNVVTDHLDEMGDEPGRREHQSRDAIRRRVIELLCEVIPLNYALELTGTDGAVWAERRDRAITYKRERKAERLFDERARRDERAQQLADAIDRENTPTADTPFP